MKLILLDTNALMAIAQMRIDLFAELERACDFPYHVAVLEGTLTELQGISLQGGKEKSAASLALQLLKAKKVEVMPSKGKVDDELVAHSLQGILVLTQDRELQQRLTKPFLMIKQRKKVVVVR